MAKTEMTLWLRRKWWVEWFLLAMLPVAWAVKLSGRDVNPLLDWIGTFMGRHGFKIGLE